MSKHNVVELSGRETVHDELTELIRDGARKLIREALESEVSELLSLAFRPRRSTISLGITRRSVFEYPSLKIERPVPRVSDVYRDTKCRWTQILVQEKDVSRRKNTGNWYSNWADLEKVAIVGKLQISVAFLNNNEHSESTSDKLNQVIVPLQAAC